MQAAPSREVFNLYCVDNAFSRSGDLRDREGIIAFDRLREVLTGVTALNLITESYKTGGFAFDSHIPFLAAAIRDNSTISVLTLNLDHMIGSKDQDELYKAIAANPQIAGLNMIVKDEVGFEAMKFKYALLSSPTPKVIDLELLGAFPGSKVGLLQTFANSPSDRLTFSSFKLNGDQKLEVASKVAGEVTAGAGGMADPSGAAYSPTAASATVTAAPSPLL